LLATRAPVLVAPAMHTEMWEHPAVQENLATLRRRGVHVVAPAVGRLAGGDVGAGRLAEPDEIVDTALAILGRANGALRGRRVVVTAGGTREPIDPVRYLGNRSSGKMGHAVARAALRAGAEVVVVTSVPADAPSGCEVVRAVTADEMHGVVAHRVADADVVVMAAAVADFRPKAVADRKLKKRDGVPEVVLEPTVDILEAIGRAKRRGQIVVGFSAETEELEANARAKLVGKHVDLMVANDVAAPDSGFEVDTNRAVLLDSTGRERELPLLTKDALAAVIVDAIAELLGASGSAEPKEHG
jgi:phosphopantothenoylcysteine decarboxylase/phosphopantothenate--cysteine ligase